MAKTGLFLHEAGIGLGHRSHQGGHLVFVNPGGATGNDQHGCFIGQAPEYDGFGNLRHVAAKAGRCLGRGLAAGGQHHDRLVVIARRQQGGDMLNTVGKGNR